MRLTKVAVAGAAVLALGMTACGGSDEPAGHTIRLTAVQAGDTDYWYLDRSGGTPFEIRDASGSVVATGELSEPSPGGDGLQYGLLGDVEVATATVEVPDAAFYQLTVTNAVSSPATYSRSDLASNAWEMVFAGGVGAVSPDDAMTPEEAGDQAAEVIAGALEDALGS